MADEKAAPVEAAKNCPACKKVLKRRKKYYRNGAYYCNVSCFKKAASEKAGAAAEPAAA